MSSIKSKNQFHIYFFYVTVVDLLHHFKLMLMLQKKSKVQKQQKTGYSVLFENLILQNNKQKKNLVFFLLNSHYKLL